MHLVHIDSHSIYIYVNKYTLREPPNGKQAFLHDTAYLPATERQPCDLTGGQAPASHVYNLAIEYSTHKVRHRLDNKPQEQSPVGFIWEAIYFPS